MVPVPVWAHAEQERADGLAARVVVISADPGHPSRESLPLYREAARLAFESAARFAVQPLVRGW